MKTKIEDPSHLLGFTPDVPKISEPLPKRDKAIGNKASQYLLTSYTIDDTCAILVTAKENREGAWDFVGSINNETVIAGTIHGGRARAVTYIKFVRNGILSRRMRGKVNPQKEQA